MITPIRPVHDRLLHHAEKRNPDAAELIRAKTGRVIGGLTSAADRDEGAAARLCQRTCRKTKKAPWIPSSALSLSIAAMTGMIGDLEPETARMKKAAGEGYATATDLADWMVRTLKIPFRDAHHRTGRIVAKAAEAGVALHRLPLAAMREVEPRNGDESSAFLLLLRPLGKKQIELRRHRAQKRARASKEMAAQALERETLTSPSLLVLLWYI